MSPLSKGLLLYLCLAIAIAFATPQVIFSNGHPSDNTFLSFFSLGYDNGDYSFGSVASGDLAKNNATFTKQSNIPSGQTMLLLVDPIYQIFSWVGSFFKLLFSPMVLLTSPAFVGASPVLAYIFIPLIFLVILGLIYFIRSGS